MAKASDPGGLSSRVWKFFASVKLTVVLLLSLAVTSIIGTLIPQNGSPFLYLNKYGQSLYTLFKRLGLFDMYHSWWFQVLLCLLVVNIIVCSIDRLRATWKIIFPRTPSFHINRFRRVKHRQQWRVPGTPEKVKALYLTYIKKHFRTHRVESNENGFLIFGEKGRWTRLGVYAVHSSVLLLVAGAFIGSLFGFEGFVNIPEGESIGHISLINSNTEKDLGFLIRCNKFTIDYYKSGMPREYRSSLSILRNGRVLFTKDILVNDPLRFAGINIFQSSYGRIPKNPFKVVFTERSSGMTYEKEAAMGKEIKLPADKGVLVVDDFKSDFSFRGVNLKNMFICRLIRAGEEPRRIIIPVDFPRFDRMRGGEFAISVSGVDYKHYTGLQVTRDPGVPVVYAGFILMIIGCYITFFMFHKKVCVELTENNGLTDVMVSGVSGKNRPGMAVVTKRLANRLKHLT